MAAGEVVSPEEPLSIQLEYPKPDVPRATSLRVEFRQPDETLAGIITDEMLFSEEELLEPALPPVDTPPQESGPYILHVEAYRRDELLFTEERKIFVLINPPRALTASVSTRQPSALIARRSRLRRSIPAGLKNKRISTGDRIFGGYSKNHSLERATSIKVRHRSGLFPADRWGTHTLTAKLFPWGPDEGVDESLRRQFYHRRDRCVYS